MQQKVVTLSEILNTDFFNNSRALTLRFRFSQNHQFKISECIFRNQRLPQTTTYNAAVVMEGNSSQNAVTLEKSRFIDNQGFHGDGSALLLQGMKNFTLSDVNVTDNFCTGIRISGSKMKLVNTINLLRNHGIYGGALSMAKSHLALTASSRVLVINNTAGIYGGGIYSDVTCSGRCRVKCFFQFEEGSASPDSNVFLFSGNSAKRGGDVVFGGCLQCCSITLNGSYAKINENDPSNIFWDLVSTKNVQSSSTFATYPKQVVFCANTSSSSSGITCSSSLTVNVYRGQIFNVPLMIRDEFCYPSVEVMEANVIGSNLTLQLEGEKLQKGEKVCSNYPFALKGGVELKTAKISLDFVQHQLFSSTPVILTVNLVDCPAGYEVNSKGLCDCHPVLKAYEIECIPRSYSLKIPAQTWVGELAEKSGSIAVKRDCLYCKKEDKMIRNISGLESDRLCDTNRRSVLCGACIKGYSLQLGGNECADCSNSTYKGVLLLIAFAVIGIALVLLLLGLNLTVSTGMINGLIFYSNIVYLNSDTLLPITREGNSTHLQNTVRILYTFQAWINLDFGITTCFFDGYDTYISIWMQFVFPLYIWLLILIIVLASRYSSRISKMTTSNTVSVLSTLLLLSYAKLLKTSIEAAAFTDVTSIYNLSRYRTWILDGNIPYLQGKHIPLFLMSLLTILVYMVPLTLLVLLGPLLQAKSHYRVLNWINKLKPFLDTFYGPYTSRYRYWPGILLLARVLTYTYYSLGDSSFNLLTVSVVVAVLLVCWMLIGKTENTLLHQQKLLNCLELFFLFNLEIFAVASIYHTQITKNTTNQQGLVVGMVGSVLIAFCGILVYQIFSFIVRFIPAYNKKDKASQPSSPLKSADITTKTTYSVVEIKEGAMPANELREPLLSSS